MFTVAQAFFAVVAGCQVWIRLSIVSSRNWHLRKEMPCHHAQIMEVIFLPNLKICAQILLPRTPGFPAPALAVPEQLCLAGADPCPVHKPLPQILPLQPSA